MKLVSVPVNFIFSPFQFSVILLVVYPFLVHEYVEKHSRASVCWKHGGRSSLAQSPLELPGFKESADLITDDSR